MAKLQSSIANELTDINKKLAKTRRDNFLSLTQLISAESDPVHIETDDPEDSDEKREIRQKNVKAVNNQIEVYRQKIVKEFQKHEVVCSLRPKKRPYVYIDMESLEDEERNDRLSLIYYVDEMLADSIKIFFEKMSKQV